MTAKSQGLLEGIAIWKSYGNDDVLQGVDLKVQEGECLVMIGPSGSGKSTLLKCLNLLEPISSGSIVFQGAEIAHLRRSEASAVRRRIGMVFQSFELFQHLNAEDNIALARIKVHKDEPARARELARNLLRKVHLPDKAEMYPDELSGDPLDFVRVLVNHHVFRYTVIIHCNVVDAATQKPIKGASVAAADVSATTGADGHASLRDVPAGWMSDGSAADVRGVLSGISSAGRRPVLLARHRSELAPYGSHAVKVVDLRTTQDSHELTQPPTAPWLARYVIWLAVPRTPSVGT